VEIKDRARQDKTRYVVVLDSRGRDRDRGRGRGTGVEAEARVPAEAGIEVGAHASMLHVAITAY
jgi:hypothetical protein